jgi:hypothetical protein
MKEIALAVFLFVTQPLPPLPRQAPDEQANHTHKEPTEANKRKQATDPADWARVGMGGETNTYNTYNFASDTHPESAKQADPWTKGYTLAAIYDVLTALLVVVAAGTGWVIWKQTIETRKAAEAAKKSANALIESERAWLTAEVKNPDEPTPDSRIIWIEIPITNNGRTSARIKKVMVTSKLIPFPESIGGRPGQLPEFPEYEPERTIELEGRDIIIAPTDTLRHMHVFIWPAEWIRVKERQKSLYVYGSIEYSDTIRNLEHTTRFCSIYWVPERGYNEPTGFMFSQFIPTAYFCAT